MKTFVLKANTTFEAENIDDAFKRLGDYFLALSKNPPDEMLFNSGECCISPLSSCEHEFVSAVNEVVKNGEVCLKCGEVRS